ncbi:hypothetical protein PFLA_a1538 [Pseudoalteromonas flavipulchra NCIMB 2033 = ATCC BAA-314]|nr:hypothetical protein [Pseudoalteromonas flavipulchra NCIMB 2033 = ATCC BAA-314]
MSNFDSQDKSFLLSAVGIKDLNFKQLKTIKVHTIKFD